MAKTGGNQRGGIDGLLELLGQHGEAIGADLIAMGLRLRDVGTKALPWIDLITIVRHLPPTSALGRSLEAENEEEQGDRYWDLHAHILAAILDTLRLILWVLTGHKKKNKPEPTKRPGARPSRFGRTTMSLDEAATFMHRRQFGN